ncbi:hypothetical protein B0H10DRAFT_2015728 [Mycena sp. CBHHK59/15]|nr:hypothetical protein B0H10DRAFT_2015728 [Mycena sp. CBHHK59/15]
MDSDTGTVPSKRRKYTSVRATPEQTVALRAAYSHDKQPDTRELERLSSETGLTPLWIRAWFIRVRKKERDTPRAKTETVDQSSDDLISKFKSEYHDDVLPPDKPPSKKRGRPKRVITALPPLQTSSPPPAVKSLPLETKPDPQNVGFPSQDDSYVPPSTAPPANTTIQSPKNSLVSNSASAQQTSVRPLFTYAPIRPHEKSFFPDSRTLPPPMPRINGHAESLNWNRSDPRQSFVLHHSMPYRVSPFYAPAARPVLLPRHSHFRENNSGPPLQMTQESPSTNAWGTRPTSDAPVAYDSPVTSGPSQGHAFSANMSHAWVPWPISFHPVNRIMVASTAPPVPQYATQQTVPATLRDVSPTCSPGKMLPSPFEPAFSNESILHATSLMPLSHLRSYMPEHDVKGNGYQPAPSSAFETPIDDQFLFSSVIALSIVTDHVY